MVLNVFVIAVLAAAACYAHSKERLFLYEAILVACFLVDHFIIFAAQFLFNGYPITEVNLTFITAPGIKILILVARQVAYLLVAKELFDLKVPIWAYGVFPLLFLLYWNIQAFNDAPQSMLFVGAFYTVMQAYLLILIAICFRKARDPEHANLRKLLVASVVYVVLVMAYDSTWIFDLYNPLTAFFGKAYESNFFETLLHAYYSCLVVRAAFEWAKAQIEHHTSKAPSFEVANVDRVIQDLRLTKREAEVFRLLLEDCSYQEICDRLVVSMSTVKSHAHSIYDKAGCSRRSELRRLVTRGDRA